MYVLLHGDEMTVCVSNFSPYTFSSWYQTQVVGLGDRHLYRLSCLLVLSLWNPLKYNIKLVLVLGNVFTEKFSWMICILVYCD